MTNNISSPDDALAIFHKLREWRVPVLVNISYPGVCFSLSGLVTLAGDDFVDVWSERTGALFKLVKPRDWSYIGGFHDFEGQVMFALSIFRPGTFEKLDQPKFSITGNFKYQTSTGQITN